MAFHDIELQRIKNTVEKFLEKERPPVHVRPELDLSYSIKGQSLELLEIRPHWVNKSEKMIRPYAKATYVKSQEIWKIYWQRSDLKWHSYEPHPEVKKLEDFLAIVSADEYACFYG